MKNSTNIKVANKYQSMVTELFFEAGDNHYVAHITPGFEYDGSHTIIETSQKEMKSAIRNIEPCTCNECVPAEKEVEAPALEVVAPSSVEVLETRGGKCEKIIVAVIFDKLNFIITEYNGFVCDVTVDDAVTGEFIYKSSKMSIKHALEVLGYEGEQLKEARKQVMSLKKAAKASA